MLPKADPIRDEAYLVWLRGERCILTGLPAQARDSVVAMHVGTLGKGIKSSDDETLPILNSLHTLGHQKGEVSMLRSHAPDDVLRAAFRALARERYRAWKESGA